MFENMYKIHYQDMQHFGQKDFVERNQKMHF